MVRGTVRVIVRCARVTKIFTAAVLLAYGSAVAAQQPTPTSLKPTPAAMELFERDWVLMNWALKFYDANHDILLQSDEAAAAAAAFRKLADTNGDGRVTPEEFRAAREAILKGD
jgi:hypothetical protein